MIYTMFFWITNVLYVLKLNILQFGEGVKNILQEDNDFKRLLKDSIGIVDFCRDCANSSESLDGFKGIFEQVTMTLGSNL